MATLPNSTEANLSQLTSSVEAFRAKTLASLDCEGASGQEREAGSTQTCFGSLASYDPGSFSWRTSQACLFHHLQMNQHPLAEFLGIWPRSGLMRNGTVYQLQPLAPRTREIECSLLPTCRTQMTRNTKGRDFGTESYRANLEEYLGGPPTPEFAEEMMGFQRGWTDLKPAVTPSCPKSPNGSDAE